MFINYPLWTKIKLLEIDMSVLSEIFGNCPQAKIIEAFAENYNDKLYAADIVRMTNVAKATVHSHIHKLLEEGLINKKEKIGTIQFYQLNLDNPKAKMILMLERFIVSERLEKFVVQDLGEVLEKSPAEDGYITQSEYEDIPYTKTSPTYSNNKVQHISEQSGEYIPTDITE